ncbi:nucleoside triphosphate pyrophosphohydrolase [Sphingomonas sp. RG327]|uniref:Nucleoside triphosphate pyrophosphohydrolase n=1 Tax=Sphingomonas anseongensis TaxID=2908207 RepID=A0ABT0RD94_9SPHN|nr:nucleoside triphosphate pyrophosphohydrolase [Sphingomonas anseongensis]MCL6678235.1 nucleoside triphosphate pyrophosphohydrolase [Sphingomonas anseongensis]
MNLERLVAIMRRLRDPERGCEWDLKQSFETIAPYTIEEAYEVADAIDRGDMDALEDELGDLQLQVVFHAQMAEERGLFSLDNVIGRICDKLERRHPHIFGNASESPGWDAIKAAERKQKPDDSALAGVANTLPALDRAMKLQRRAARTGFDWPDSSGARAKVNEELQELDGETDQKRRTEELGDLLFAVVNLARHLKIDPEDALRHANRKFEKRFRAIETTPGFDTMSLDEMEALWVKAKAAQSD